MINKREKVGLDHFDDHKAFIEHSNDMQDVHKNINDYNPRKKHKVLIVFDDMTADMMNNKNVDSIVTELLIRGRKLNISIAFITQSYFKVPKDVRLNSTYFFIMKISNKIELQQIALNYEYLTGDEYNFYKIEDPTALLNDIEKGKISLEEAKEKQKKLLELFKYDTKRK